MGISKSSLNIAVVCLLILVTTVFCGSPSPKISGDSQTQLEPVVSAISGPSSDINVQLSAFGMPELGRLVRLKATFSLPFDQIANNVSVHIDLPEGLELVDANFSIEGVEEINNTPLPPVSRKGKELFSDTAPDGPGTWRGHMVRGRKYQMFATIKPKVIGDWRFEVNAFFSPREGEVFGGLAYLYAHVDVANAMFSKHATKLNKAPILQTVPSLNARPPMQHPGEGNITPTPSIELVGRHPFGILKHLAVTKNGNTYSFYRDGVLDGTATSNYIVPDAANPHTLGWAEGASCYTGIMDEVRFSNVARSADWMKASFLSETNTLVSYGTTETNVSNSSSTLGKPIPMPAGDLTINAADDRYLNVSEKRRYVLKIVY